MSGRGRFTLYVPPASVRNSRLARLFKGNDAIESPFAATMASGDNEQARKDTVSRGEALLRPNLQQGDPQYYPQGVHLDYTGDPNGIQPPNLENVKWSRPGDPSNGYFPDLRSPGPGRTDPQARDTDPELTVEEVEGPQYVTGAPGTSTVSPTSRIEQIRKANTLGQALVLGKNSGNEP